MSPPPTVVLPRCWHVSRFASPEALVQFLNDTELVFPSVHVEPNAALPWVLIGQWCEEPAEASA